MVIHAVVAVYFLALLRLGTQFRVFPECLANLSRVLGTCIRPGEPGGKFGVGIGVDAPVLTDSFPLLT